MHNTIEKFEKWLIEEGKSFKTIESYCGDVKLFHRYLITKNIGENTVLSRFTFTRYKEYLIKQQYAVATINKKVNSLKVYNDFLIAIGVLPEQILSLKKDRITIAVGSEKEVTSMSEAQVEKLLFYVEDEKKVSIRNKLIVYLLLYTGVRVSELVGIELSDIDLLTASLTIRGKGGKLREVSLRNDVVELIKSYVKTERARNRYCNSNYLLISQRAKKMHRDAVRDWLSNVSTDLGYHLHPHLFRHTFATRLIRKGVEITTVSRLLGHSTVNMSAKFYIQTSRDEKMNAVRLL